MIFLNHFILAFASVTYALNVPVDSNPCVFFPLIYPSLLTYFFSVTDPSMPHTLMVAQPHAGRSAAYGPTSRMSARQNICSKYGTPYDTTKYYCTAPTCTPAGNGVCGPYCGNSLYPCPGGSCNPMDSCGPAPQGCIPDDGKCINSALEIITLRWPALVVVAIQSVLSEFQTCLKDVENDLPLITCLAACGQFGSDDLQTVECVVSCVAENGVPSSCVTLLGDVALALIAASSFEGAILVMYVEAVLCLLAGCST
jgi:hypothetical protein